MKKYRLKEEVKSIFVVELKCRIEPLDYWVSVGVVKEALEEVKEVLTYEDVAREMFEGKKFYHLDDNGKSRTIENDPRFEVPNNAKTSYQLECLMASNMLTNVANYLNEGCEFKEGEVVYHFKKVKGQIIIVRDYFSQIGITYFKTSELARIGQYILGEETIIKALTKNF